MRVGLSHIFVAAALSACSSGIPEDVTRSGFLAATSAGVEVTLNNERKSDLPGSIGRVYYVTGTDSAGAAAFAGTVLSDAPGPMPGVQAYYTTNWELVGIRNIRMSGNLLIGDKFVDGGSMILTFDQSTGSLTGSNAGTSGTLSVAGTAAAGDIGGSVSYAGVTGSLDGDIGVNGLLGAYHGNSDALVYGGGLASVAVVP